MIFEEFPMRCKRLMMGVTAVLFAAPIFSGISQAETFDVVQQGTVHDALYDICFDGKDGLAVGYDGSLLESDNSGKSWKAAPVEILESITLLGASCDGARRVVVGQEGHIFIERESTWQAAESGSSERLLAVDMNRQGLAVAVGGFGAVLRSKDSGESWEALTFDWEAILGDFLEPHLYDVNVDEAGVITLIGEFELIYRSTDGGETWKTLHTGESSLFSITLLDSGLGFAVGQDNKVLKTVDGGDSWKTLTATENGGGNLLSIWSSPQGEVVITGIRVMLRSSDSGLSWQSSALGDVATNWYQALASSVPSEKAEQDVPGQEQLYMVGHSGRIVRLTQE